MSGQKSNTVATAQRNAVYAQWVSALQIEADTTAEDDGGFDPADILGSILSADTFEEAVERQDSSLRSGKTLVGKAHRINDFRLRRSDAKYTANERSLGVFAIVSAVDGETGEEFSYGVGASNVLAVLWQARQFGKLPGDFMIHSRDTQEGELLSLRPISARTVRAEASE
jgi:hypothetical protein